MKDTLKEADLILAQIMGFKARRPRNWGKVVKAYAALDSVDQRNVTAEKVQGLIDWFKPGAKKKRNQAEKQAKAKRKAVKAKAREIRNQPENKNQKWNWKAERKWAETDETDEDGRTQIIVKAKKPRTFARSQYNPEGVLVDLLKLLDKGDKAVFLKAFAKQLSEEIQETRMKSSLGQRTDNDSGVEPDQPIQNNPEFSDGFQHGAFPVPGKKLSGNARRLLGMK